MTGERHPIIMRNLLADLMLTLSLAGCLYLLLAAVLVRRFASKQRHDGVTPKNAPAELKPVTILKPLHGDEPGLYERQRSFCEQDYGGEFEILFGVQDPNDQAIPAVRRLAASCPARRIELVIDGRNLGANRKISNLANLARHAANETLVIADSDIEVSAGYLRNIAAALEQPGTGAVTCLYHGLHDGSIWSKLAAMWIDTQFIPGAIAGLSLGLANPCFGSTIALRQSTLDAIGGFEAFANQLADDHAIGEAVRRLGLEVRIAPPIAGHACNEATWRELWHHELRWARTIRGIDPVGHAGSVLMQPLPLAVIAALLGNIAGWPTAVTAIMCRLVLAETMERSFALARHDRRLIPLREAISFMVFVWSYCGRAVRWRDRDYALRPDGSLEART